MKVFRNPEILWREEDDSRAEAVDGLAKGEDVSDVGTAVLFSDGIMLSLNLLGAEIWKRCDGRSINEIVSELTAQFDAEPDVVKEDALAFLSELKQKGFVRYEDE